MNYIELINDLVHALFGCSLIFISLVAKKIMKEKEMRLALISSAQYTSTLNMRGMINVGDEDALINIIRDNITKESTSKHIVYSLYSIMYHNYINSTAKLKTIYDALNEMFDYKLVGYRSVANNINYNGFCQLCKEVEALQNRPGEKKQTKLSSKDAYVMYQYVERHKL